MVIVNKVERCQQLINKGRFDGVMCNFCTKSNEFCATREGYLDLVREYKSDAFDERREMAKEGVENG